jgi:hypothetical protein
MCFVYVVRCNFTEPAKEAAWNAWYSGPKIKQMLAKPHFVTCQRFRRSAGAGRDYLALWTLRSPEAFKTQEYTADWGFFEWQSYITDWSRDLFEAGTTPEAAFAVPTEGALHVMSFDGMSAGDAREAIAQSGADMMWLPVVGLDRHTPMMGLRPVPADAPAPNNELKSIQTAIYRPICPLQMSLQ